MNAQTLRPLRLGITLIFLLGGCSGEVSVDIDGPEIPSFPPQQLSQAITTHGAITGFGNISINNVHYDAAAATVSMNGLPAMWADLQLGQVVTVKGRIYIGETTGIADSIRFDADAIGPVSAIDASNSTLTAMGQTILTDADTVFSSGIDPDSYAGLTVGDTVQVSGFRDADGKLRATRLERADAVEEQVVGRVSGINVATFRFTINALTVDYSNALLIDLPGGEPGIGRRLKAVGTLEDGVFVAERLESAPDFTGSTGRRAQLAGFITRFNSPGDFEINGTAVSVEPTTRYANGDSDDLHLNARVIVDGDVGSTGRITADRITFGNAADTVTTLHFDHAGFTEIAVPSVFSVTVSQGATYSVDVVVDSEATDRVTLNRSGSVLTIDLAPGNGSIDVLEAYVVMPALERISLSGVVNAVLIGFDQPQLTVEVGGVSRLRGLSMRLDTLQAEVSGVSMLDFTDTRPLASANIEMSGITQARLNMDIGAVLTGSVSTGQGTGTSLLYYYGTDVFVDVTTDWLSDVIWLGDTRP